MSEPDEYDAFYFPLGPEDFLAIEAITAHLSQENTLEIESSHLHIPTSTLQSPPSPDEFDAYDFSEFTAEDFEQIDKMVLASASPPPPLAQAVHSEPPEPSGAGVGIRSGIDERKFGSGGGSAHGGPRIQITVEGAANTNRSRYLKDLRGSTRARRSPYQQFRSWNRLLSVTDLTGPSWCEVQFDYGLRQKRHKALADRPSSFVTTEGKTINVTRAVAAVNDRTVNRGRSVHKVLEREILPEEVQVDITTAEERWALRLVNMLTSLHMLMDQGRCREMPVFGIVHDQLVTGIIDEIVRKPIPGPESLAVPLTNNSPNKRSAPQTPSTPSRSRFQKKSRQDMPPTEQLQITWFLSTKSRHGNDPEMASDVNQPTTPIKAETHLPIMDDPQVLPDQVEYTLHLSDTKTRIRPSLPPDEDTLASRIQLMLYSRLLTALLSSGKSSRPFDFSQVWQKADVNPNRKLSDAFLRQTGLSSFVRTSASGSDSGPCCLTDLTLQWAHTVEALNVAGIDDTLSLVYRNQPQKWHSKGKQKASASPSLSDQEAQDLAAAIQASINDVHPGGGYEAVLSQAISGSLKDAVQSGKVSDGDLGILMNPFGPPISDVPGTLALEGHLNDALLPQEYLSTDRELALPTLQETISEAAVGADDAAEPEVLLATAQTIGPSVEETPTVVVSEQKPADTSNTRPCSPISAEGDEEGETLTAAELDTEAKVLGTKEFKMDDAFLDEYLTRVLAWWYGERPPQGVEVELTRRCVTCEYRDGCEWREKKAQEALERYNKSRGDTATPDSVEVWL